VVVTNDLALDSGPAEIEETAAVTPAVLAAGEQVWVLETRQTTSGAWHLVVADQMVPEFEIPFGWVTAERDGAPVLGAAPLACPDPPLSVDQAAELGRFGGLACYGNVPIEVRGFTPMGCGAGGSPRTGTPDWLNGTWSGIGIGDREPSPPDFEVGPPSAPECSPDTALRPAVDSLDGSGSSADTTTPLRPPVAPRTPTGWWRWSSTPGSPSSSAAPSSS